MTKKKNEAYTKEDKYLIFGLILGIISTLYTKEEKHIIFGLILGIISTFILMGLIFEAGGDSLTNAPLDAVCVELYGDNFTYVESFGQSSDFKCKAPEEPEPKELIKEVK